MKLIKKLLLTISITSGSIASIIFPTILTSCNNKNESSNKNEIKEVNINYEYETIKK
ncbi:MAG: hypothetical protein K2I36_01820 [Ureaplasma sp.]|nr:hypothetical protein [Ureaplasma sp.]MDE7221883.1 hypothetical protein [Ureaplasma sp.]